MGSRNNAESRGPRVNIEGRRRRVVGTSLASCEEDDSGLSDVDCLRRTERALVSRLIVFEPSGYNDGRRKES